MSLWYEKYNFYKTHMFKYETKAVNWSIDRRENLEQKESFYVKLIKYIENLKEVE